MPNEFVNKFRPEFEAHYRFSKADLTRDPAHPDYYLSAYVNGCFVGWVAAKTTLPYGLLSRAKTLLQRPMAEHVDTTAARALADELAALLEAHTEVGAHYGPTPQEGPSPEALAFMRAQGAAALVANLTADQVRIDTYEGHGEGSWSRSVWRGVRLTHLPSGIEVRSQTERSQYANKQRCLGLLLSALKQLLGEEQPHE